MVNKFIESVKKLFNRCKHEYKKVNEHITDLGNETVIVTTYKCECGDTVISVLHD